MEFETLIQNIKEMKDKKLAQAIVNALSYDEYLLLSKYEDALVNLKNTCDLRKKVNKAKFDSLTRDINITKKRINILERVNIK